MKTTAMVLAAGMSMRMGPVNKLGVLIDGIPMIARVVDAALASAADDLLVVTGHQAAEIRGLLAGRQIRFVHNADFSAGMSTSLKCGLAAVAADVDAVLVCLGDMPRVSHETLDRLIAGFDQANDRCIGVPMYQGRRGNPVLLGRRFFPELRTIQGDVGARGLITRHARHVFEVAVGSDAVLVDLDTPEDLKSHELRIHSDRDSKSCLEDSDSRVFL